MLYWSFSINNRTEMKKFQIWFLKIYEHTIFYKYPNLNVDPKRLYTDYTNTLRYGREF
jgi:hypothetical protein